MRTAFINQLIAEARKHDNIFLIVGDLGYNVVEPFANEFPNRFINCGIAEQNMAGLAAGLSTIGYNVYIYSIGNFPTLRCIEQLRNDVAYHKANVKIVAVGGGFAYGDLGATHHATEAIGMMRSIPNMTVCSPSDPIEAMLLTKFSATYDGPMYIQLGKAGEKCIHREIKTINIGDIIEYNVSGKDKAILMTGAISAYILESQDVSEFDLYTLPFIKPINVNQILEIANNHNEIVIIEEHQKSTGVGSAVIEILNDLHYERKIKEFPYIRRIAINDIFSEVSGTQNYLRSINNLNL